jgi:hypothetical protein
LLCSVSHFTNCYAECCDITSDADTFTTGLVIFKQTPNLVKFYNETLLSI